MTGRQRQPALKRTHPGENLPGPPEVDVTAEPQEQPAPANAATPETPAGTTATPGTRPAPPVAAGEPLPDRGGVDVPAEEGQEERLSAQHNVRLRPSTKRRLSQFVDLTRYKTGDRSTSIASVTDLALRTYLDEHGG